MPWSFVIDALPYPGPRAHWFHHWTERDDRRWLRFGRDRGRYVLRFEQWATFVIDPQLQAITCFIEPNTPLDTIRHLLLNQVMPLVPRPAGHLVLHAAAVRVGGEAIGLVGPGGAGKSSLCAALHQAGCGLITDDALVVERRANSFLATPSYPAIRLWPDTIQQLPALRRHVAQPVAHYTRKVRIADPVFEERPVPISRLFLLMTPGATADAATTRRVSSREAVIALLGSTFQIDIEDRGQAAQTLEMLAVLTEQVPVYTLTYPWDLGRLDQSAQQLVAAVTTA